MNVYSCFYKGNTGYCCRQHNKSWMFVPDLGQYDNKIYRNIDIEDLVFTNPYVKKYELDNELRFCKTSFAVFFSNAMRKKYKPQTIGGLLFYPMSI